MDAETELQMVTRHITGGARVIASKIGVIARLKAEGLEARFAEGLLASFERTQALHRDHLGRLI